MITILILACIIGLNVAFNMIHLVYLNKCYQRCRLYTLIYDMLHGNNKHVNLLMIIICIALLNIIYLLTWLISSKMVRIED